MYKAQNRFGFTLVELLVVILLIALIAGASGGIFVGTYKNMLVTKAAREFLMAAKYARVLAIERADQCKLQLDSQAGKFQLVFERLNEDSGQLEQVTVSDLYFKPVQFAKGVKFERIKIESGQLGLMQGKTQTIVFRPDGTAQSALIQIGDGQRCFTVSVVAATGKVKLWDKAADKVKTGSIDLDGEI